MPADRDASSALLYLPSEALVRATVDGDGAAWFESLAYVPDAALVDDVLRRSALTRRPRPVFRFPSSITDRIPERRRPIGFRRAASAVAAVLGVSPSVLAAATVAHILASAAVGQFVFQQARGPTTTPPSVSAPIETIRIVYLPRRAAAPGARRRPGVRGRGGMSDQRADTAGLRQEFLLEGNDLQVAGDGGARAAVLVRLLRMLPGARLRISGAGPVASAGDSLRKGRREAEAFERLLLSQGVDRGQLELAVIPLADQTCAVNEPLCARGRSRVVAGLIRR